MYIHVYTYVHTYMYVCIYIYTYVCVRMRLLNLSDRAAGTVSTLFTSTANVTHPKRSCCAVDQRFMTYKTMYTDHQGAFVCSCMDAAPGL